MQESALLTRASDDGDLALQAPAGDAGARSVADCHCEYLIVWKEKLRRMKLWRSCER